MRRQIVSTMYNNADYQYFSIITQVIIEIRALSLVKDCVICRYNHSAWGDYSVFFLLCTRSRVNCENH